MSKNRLLGEILIEMGLASRELIVECLNMQTEIHHKGLGPIPIGELVVKTGCMTMSDLERALSKQTKYRLPS